MPQIVAVVGMCGAGKSVVADMLVDHGYHFLRFGQVALDEVKRQGLEPTEANERPIRDGLRKEHGPAAFAILNMPKIEALFQKGNVVADGLYSWAEYKVLKEKFGEQLVVLAVYASPKTRYERLDNRKLASEDTDLRNRHMSPEESAARDKAEIEISDKGGPIAMADHLINNEGSLEELKQQVESFLERIPHG